MGSADTHHHHDHDHGHVQEPAQGHGPDGHHGHDHDGHGHGDGDGHGHGPGHHHHAPANFGRAFAVGITVTLGYVAAEFFYGVIAHSLALLADAGHNLGDALGLGLAWGAAIASKRSPSAGYTYGLRSTSIMAALINAVTLLIITGGIAGQALQRLANPEPSDAITVIAVAAIGIAINGGVALMFLSGRKDDLNIKAAFSHMMADAAITAGVVVSGAVALATDWLWLDPVVSLVISALIVAGSWTLLRDSVKLALHAVPGGIDRPAIETYLASVDGVAEVHDLHIWGISTTETALTVHLVRPGAALDDVLVCTIAAELKSRFKIAHATIQIESGEPEHGCGACALETPKAA
jgi:cobalt-zinc-cadmium efflux system protein